MWLHRVVGAWYCDYAGRACSKSYMLTWATTRPIPLLLYSSTSYLPQWWTGTTTEEVPGARRLQPSQQSRSVAYEVKDDSCSWPLQSSPVSSPRIWPRHGGQDLPWMPSQLHLECYDSEWSWQRGCSDLHLLYNLTDFHSPTGAHRVTVRAESGLNWCLTHFLIWCTV